MQMLIDWIMQIVIFMLIGTIVQFLLPKNTLKKYVNIVIGLLLLLILTKPLLYLFSIPLPTTFDYLERSLFSDEMYVEKTEREISVQKNDIENEQAAYIWNEAKEELIAKAETPLQSKYNVDVIDITFEKALSEHDESKVIVHVALENNVAKDTSSNIEPIEISTLQPKNEAKEDESLAKTERIVNELATIWEIDPQLIQLKWERGT